MDVEPIFHIPNHSKLYSDRQTGCTCHRCVPAVTFFSRKQRHTHQINQHCAPRGEGQMSTKKVKRRAKQKADKAVRKAQEVLAD